MAEQELLKIVNAANEAHKTLHELAVELGKRQRGLFNEGAAYWVCRELKFQIVKFTYYSL